MGAFLADKHLRSADVAAIIAVWAIFLGQGAAVAAVPSAPSAVARPQAYSFAFQDADIARVVEEVLGATLHLPYTIDPGVTGKMSLRVDQKLTHAQLYEALESALAANDIVLVRHGDSLLVEPRSKAKASASLQTSLSERSRRGGYQVVAVPLSYALPSEVARALTAVAPASSVVSTDDKLGLIMVGGTDRELDSLLQTIRVFDQSGLQASKIKWFELARAPAQSVADELDRILKASGAGGVTIVPLRRLNGMFVFARTPQALDEVGQWVAKLDVPPKENATSFWVYRPRSVSAEGLSRSLSTLLFDQPTGAAAAGTAGPIPTVGVAATPVTAAGAASAADATLAPSSMRSPDGSIRLGVDRESNTLLISAPQANWIQIQKILQEIDRPPLQVLIEASILEVTLTNDTKLGVDWSWMNGSSPLTISSSGQDDGSVAARFPGFAVTYLKSDIKAAVSTLGTRSSVEVVSAPKIMTLNNRPAMLEIGNQVPVITQSAQSISAPGSPIVDSVSYRGTGVILNVTPQVSDEDNIVLTIDQEVSSVGETTSSNINSPTIQQRKFQSSLVLKSGGVVALGGLISTNRGKGSSGLPVLSDVPVVGALFGSQKRSNDRTELIVLLSAKIIRDQDASDAALSILMQDMHEIEGRGLHKAR